MKFGKKIFSLLLTVCLVMTVIPVYATTLTTNTDELWDLWDASGKIETSATIVIKKDAVSVAFDNGVLKNALSKGVMKDYVTTVNDGILTVGENDSSVCIPMENKAINTISGYWFTTVFPIGGQTAKDMVALAATDEAFDAMLIHDEEGKVFDYKVENKADEFIANIWAYLNYKISGNTDVNTAPAEYRIENVKITIFAKNTFETSDCIPLGTFFVGDDKITTFVGGENPWKGQYATFVGASSSMYKSAVQFSGLDGPYTVFTAPSTGEYDVWANKRDFTTDSTQRYITIDVSGEIFTYENEYAPETVDNEYYYWEPALERNTVFLTKGQNVVIRIMSETGNYASAFGFAFVPRAGDTVTDIRSATVPETTNSGINGASIETSVPVASDCIAVTIFDSETLISAGAAEAFYPNIRKYDAKGNFITQPTLLDALVTAEIEYDAYGIEPNTLNEGYLVEGSKLYPTPMTYDTTKAAGNTWPCGATETQTNYTNYWKTGEKFYSASTEPFTFSTYVPRNGKYFMIANGMGWDTTRYITVKVDNTTMKSDSNSSKFFGSMSTNVMTNVQSYNGVVLTKGWHTITVTTSGKTIRMDYLALVPANSKEEAKTIQDTISSKEDFYEVFNAARLSYYTDAGNFGRQFVVTVNGIAVADNFDQYIIKNDDVIEVKYAINMGTNKITGFGPTTGSGDIQTAATKFNIDNYTSYEWLPTLNVSEENAFAGWYLNGYATIKANLPSTSGDDTKVRMYIHNFPITASGINSSNSSRLQLGSDAYKNTEISKTINGEVYAANIPKTGEVSDTYYDFSGLYLTNGIMPENTKVVATETENGFVFRTNVTVPATFIIVTKDGNGNIIVTSMIKETLDFMDADGYELSVSKGETVYVWQGSELIAPDTTMKPLCAPVTK